MTRSEVRKIIGSITSEDGKVLPDNENFHDKEGKFDLHRIFKLPRTVDGSTGVVVSEEFNQLPFADKLNELR